MKRVLLAALCLVAFHATALAADASLKTVKEKGKLVLGLDDSFPPMGFRNEDNQIVGYDIDVAREVAKRLGVQLAPQAIDWNAKEQELNTGKVDCIWNGFTITDERRKAMTFTKPYLRNAQVVVVKKASGYTTLASLSGKKVGLQAGSSAAGALEGATAFRASIKQSANEVITLVKDTALAQTIGVAELFRVAQNASARQFSTMPIFIAGAFYFVMNWAVSELFLYLERKLAYYS
jgi:polar amino acid transport system substrate-binding protein